jgi:hypothetical protein
MEKFVRVLSSLALKAAIGALAARYEAATAPHRPQNNVRLNETQGCETIP